MGIISKYIISFLLLTGFVSAVYFLSLVAGLSFVIPVLLSFAFIIVLYKVLFKNQVTITTRLPWWAVIIFILCLCLLTINASKLAIKHGGWDAWAIWNLHTRYLIYPAYWKNMFLNVESEHPDYPLALPAFLAFTIRLFANHFSLIITFLFSLLVTLSAPLLIFSELIKKNIFIALLAFYLLAQDQFYIATGLSQYADTLLSLFFLAAMVAVNHAPNSPRYVAVCAALLACCAFTKNEGALLAGIFFLFYARVFLSKNNIKYTLIGAVIPLAALLIFKIICPNPNDMASSLNSETMNRLFQKDRYLLIYTSFRQNLDAKFYYLKIGVILSLALSLIQRKLPGKQFLFLTVCLLCYMGIYVITPHGLEWHLSTSQDRLMHQLMPPMVYVIAMQFCGRQYVVDSWRKR